MNAGQEILIYVIQTLGGLYVFVTLMRVLLQASRADYYNPVSQFVVKATQKPVTLLGKIVPSWKRVDLAAILWVLIVQMLITEISALTVGVIIDPLTVLTWAAIASAHLFLTIIFWGMVVLIIISFATMLGGMMIRHAILDLLRQLMAPIMHPIQRLLPPMGGIDLSPIILFMLINVLKIITFEMARSTGLNPLIVVGF